MIISVNANRKIVIFNPAAEKTFGYKKEEVLGKQVQILYADSSQSMQVHKTTMNTSGFDGEVLNRKKDGGTFISRLSSTVLRDEKGVIIGFMGISRDVTEHKQAEEILRKSEEKYRRLIENLQDNYFFYVHNIKGIFTYVSPSLTNILGYSTEKFLTHYSTYLTDNPINKEVIKHTERSIQGIKQPPYEVEIYHKDGTIRSLQVQEIPLFDNNRKVVAVEGIAQDITERKRMEEKISSEKEFTEMLINCSVDGILAYDRDCRYTVWNNGMENISGMRKEECLGKSAFDVFPFLKEIGEDKYFYATLEGRNVIVKDRPFVIPNTNKKGVFEGYYSPLRNKSGEIIGGLAIIRDITERKKAEEMRQEQKKALEQKNIALSEVLGQIELEKKQIKDNIISNAENLLLPIIQKLRLKGESRKYIQLLLKNLQELTSSFGTRLTEKETKLTSREIEICNMVKNGLTSKEIASLLNISFLTIEKHRINIRRKLGIINKDTNLTSFLKTL
jgi:PAS domain S-box-containing protein